MYTSTWPITDEKKYAYQDIINLLLGYTDHYEVISTEKLLVKMDALGYSPDDVRFMYWTLVGQGKLVRTSKGVIKSLDIPNIAFTTFGTNYGR